MQYPSICNYKQRTRNDERGNDLYSCYFDRETSEIGLSTSRDCNIEAFSVSSEIPIEGSAAYDRGCHTAEAERKVAETNLQGVEMVYG
jgi:hypothetical protein